MNTDTFGILVRRILFKGFGAVRWLYYFCNERRFSKLCIQEEREIVTQFSAMSSGQEGRVKTASFSSRVLTYVEGLRVRSSPYGQYSFSTSSSVPVLYSSVYAVLIRSLLCDLDRLSASDREEWISYIKGFQCRDGMFRDEAIRVESSETRDYQCGWRHLTLHAIMALSALGSTADKEFSIINSLGSENRLTQWLSSLPWRYKATLASSTVQNIGTLLQYSRDRQNNKEAQQLLDSLFRWLNKTQNPKTGSWGITLSGRRGISEQVHTGYHIWLLYFFDKIELKYKENIIDLLLETRSSLGSFGPFPSSSACDDIDTIDPLVRLFKLTEYRKAEVLDALRKAVPWVLFNQNRDGGFVFERNRVLYYGHNFLSAEKNVSSLFPTWFRLLSLALLAQEIVDYTFLSQDWRFLNCPGHQFPV